MRFIRVACLLLVLFQGCSSEKQDKKKILLEMVPEYKFLNQFSEELQSKTGLVCWSYGFNSCLPKDYNATNRIATFDLSYALIKNRSDEVSIEDARTLAVFVVESLLQAVNSSQMLRPDLEIFPFVSDRINTSLYFIDENKIDLGQGICEVYCAQGKIKYQRYEIEKYTGHYPAEGNHYTVHEETYEEALEIVKKQGRFISSLNKKSPL